MSDAFLSRLQSGLGGTYVLDRELAGGGMSRLFAGTEMTLGRVVVKVLPTDRAIGDPIDRFKREAELGARLEHPHIVPVFDVGEFEDIRYFTMPFIDGETLRQRLVRSGALPADEVCRALREIGSALAYAHGRGVVHRDVKPENVFIEHGTGRALLADFGVAKAVGARSDVTHPGSTIGTPAYMSPEQVDSADIDGRSDVYSLGVVGWEMLTGQRPWTDPYDSVCDIMHRQKHELLPSMADLGIRAPRELVEAIERALLKDRRVRWATAAAFVGRLGGAKDPESAVTTQRIEARGQRPILQRSEGESQRSEPPSAHAQESRVWGEGSEVGATTAGAPQSRRQEREPEPADEGLTDNREVTVEGSASPTGHREEWRADPVRQGEWRADPARREEWRADPVRGETWRGDPVRWDDELAAVWGRRTRRGLGARYVVAAVVLVCCAAIVGAAWVGPETLMWRLTNGAAPEPVANAAAAGTSDLDTRIDRVSAGDMATGLIGIEGARGRAPRATMPMKARRSALPPTIGAPGHVEQVAAGHPRSDVRRQSSSSRDRVRGRIATALLSVQEYERVQASMSAARAGTVRTPAAPSPAPPAPPPSRP